MNTKEQPTKVTSNVVVSMEYELLIGDKVIDYSEENDPLVFIQGMEQIIPGLETQIEDMTLGESREIFVKAADAYGEYDAEDFVEVPKSEFPEEIPLEIGLEIGVNGEDGEELSAYIEEVTLDTITLNFNHPLAGKDLNFKVKIVGLRHPTEEELAHGHVHGEDLEEEE